MEWIANSSGDNPMESLCGALGRGVIARNMPPEMLQVSKKNHNMTSQKLLMLTQPPGLAQLFPGIRVVFERQFEEGLLVVEDAEREVNMEWVWLKNLETTCINRKTNGMSKITYEILLQRLDMKSGFTTRILNVRKIGCGEVKLVHHSQSGMFILIRLFWLSLPTTIDAFEENYSRKLTRMGEWTPQTDFAAT
ncbi:hypothetical protein Trydic_g17014 [Trypoxylus dichotomus]